MSFLTGRAAYLRFRVNGVHPELFGEEQLEKLRERQSPSIVSSDGVSTGWAAGDHMLDADFTLEKNVWGDRLLFELWVEVDRVPAARLKAQTAIELKALAGENPSGRPSSRQRREAKEAARNYLEELGKDGRWRSRRCFPVLWDRFTREVLFGATSTTQVDRLCNLFDRTFGVELEPMRAGDRALAIATLGARIAEVENAGPSPFVPGVSPPDVAWIADESSRDFLGNEFLLWLWYYTEVNSDTIKIDGPYTLMLARSLVLECPRGQRGYETIRHEGPTRLAEAKKAVQLGNLPRRVGVTLVRHDQQYEFTLHAETLAVASLKLPPPPDDVTEPRARQEHRLDAIRELNDSLDALYGVFLAIRLTERWADELAAMQKWLQREKATFTFHATGATA